MNLLLDTHAFLWLRFSPDKVSNAALTAYQDDNNKIFFSLVSIWEIQIKQQLGKLELDIGLADLLQEQCGNNQLELLPIKLNHILDLKKLPFHHKDPFDRLLISQAFSESMVLVSSDEFFSDYGVDVLW